MGRYFFSSFFENTFQSVYLYQHVIGHVIWQAKPADYQNESPTIWLLFYHTMKLKNDLILRKVGSDYIIVQPEEGVADLSKVFTLNNSAAYVWEALQEKEFELEDIKSLLTDRFDVDDQTALADAEELLKLFQTQNLLVTS